MERLSTLNQNPVLKEDDSQFVSRLCDRVRPEWLSSQSLMDTGDWNGYLTQMSLNKDIQSSSKDIDIKEGTSMEVDGGGMSEAASDCPSSESEWSEHEIYGLIADINDPEHPMSLSDLSVVTQDQITLDGRHLKVLFTPTIPHCSMATLIGLSIRVKLLRSLPKQMRVKVAIKPGTHESEEAINKQLSDKERVAAAIENENLITLVNRCIAGSLKDW